MTALPSETKPARKTVTIPISGLAALALYLGGMLLVALTGDDWNLTAGYAMGVGVGWAIWT